MARQRLLWTFLGLSLGSLALPAHAEYQELPESLAPGEWGLAGEFQANIGPTFSPALLLHENIGLLGGLDLFLRQSVAFDNAAFEVRAGVKWTILHKKTWPGLALWVGGHYYIKAAGGLNVALLTDYRFGRWVPYGGLMYDLDFEQELHHKLRLALGLRIGIVEHFAWFVEGGVGLAEQPLPHFVATGPRFTI